MLPKEQWALIEELDLNVFYDDGEGYINCSLFTIHSSLVRSLRVRSRERSLFTSPSFRLPNETERGRSKTGLRLYGGGISRKIREKL